MLRIENISFIYKLYKLILRNHDILNLFYIYEISYCEILEIMLICIKSHKFMKNNPKTMIRTTVVQLMMRKFNLFSKIYTMGYLLDLNFTIECLFYCRIFEKKPSKWIYGKIRGLK